MCVTTYYWLRWLGCTLAAWLGHLKSGRNFRLLRHRWWTESAVASVAEDFVVYFCICEGASFLVMVRETPVTTLSKVLVPNVAMLDEFLQVLFPKFCCRARAPFVGRERRNLLRLPTSPNHFFRVQRSWDYYLR